MWTKRKNTKRYGQLSLRTYISPPSCQDGVTKEDVFLTLKKKEARNLKVFLNYNGPIKAPITKDQQIANIEIFVKDNLIKKVPVYAAENVKKLNVFKSLFMSLNYLIWGDV